MPPPAAEKPAVEPFTWWSHTVDECKHAAESEDAAMGLTAAEAAKRLVEHGKNSLTPPERPGFLRKLWAQINSALIWILLVRLFCFRLCAPSLAPPLPPPGAMPVAAAPPGRPTRSSQTQMEMTC